jgi:ABC-type nickel/cobalt efflux system permease component RcnA
MPLNKQILFAVVAAAATLPTLALADNGPFGVGLAEPAATGGGILPDLFRTIAAWQSSFYRELTGLVARMRTDGTAVWWLCAFSFAYGVLHAAGPGHGKAIVSAYVLANRETARNGAILAMVSALAQAVTAISLVLVAAVALGATSIAMTEAARVFEIGSFAVITGLGLWLTWRKIIRPLAANFAARYAPVQVGGMTLALAGVSRSMADHDPVLRPGAVQLRGFAGHHHEHHDAHVHHDHHHAEGVACDHCAHVPSPDLARGTLDWRKAWTAVVAVGLRPCTGALIVLVFALSQGMLAGGIAATVAMAIGTGLTVAALTLAAVGARGLAGRLTGGGRVGHALHHAIEGVGALVILAFGTVMLGASLAG